MFPFVIPYPEIDPVLIQLGPFAIRWYALAYIAGLVLGWRYIVRLLRNRTLWAKGPGGQPPATPEIAEDILLFATLGVIVGGRLGYVLIYGLTYSADYYLENPLRIFEIWNGGMSFHGGFIGVFVALYFLCRSKKLSLLRIGDLVATATPIGLFFGRIANFINGELYGRPSDVSWAMVFCNNVVRRLNGGECPGGLIARHPSQLYEATLEGLLLFAVLRLATHRFSALEKPGLTAGIFLAGYGCARAFAEFFREPDAPIGNTGLTMGMLLSIPMWIGAAWLIWNALKTTNAQGGARPTQSQSQS